MKFLLVDDHAIVRRGLREIVEEAFDGVQVAEAASASEAMSHILADRWDAVVLDITMPGRNGLDVLRDAKRTHPDMPVLILSMHPEDQYAMRTLAAGADGYLTKEAATTELVSALQEVLRGRRYVSRAVGNLLADQVGRGSDGPLHEQLSDREFEVMRLIAGGRTVSQIADELSLSVKTVSTYRHRMLEKLRLETNAQVVRYAMDRGLSE